MTTPEQPNLSTQVADGQPVSQPVEPQTVPHPAPQGSEASPKPGGLSTFLKVSIVLLAALTVASISLVFIGDFEGKFERVFATFFLFAVFVVLTALDTSRDRRSEWYAPVALIANAYILGLLLIVIWMSPYDPFLLGWDIFWKSVLVILVVRLVILGTQLLLNMGDRLPSSVMSFAFVTSVLGVLSGILFTAPVGIETFKIVIPEMYWKISTATLILTAMSLAITLLLRWSYRSADREKRREERRAANAAQAQAFAVQPYGVPQQNQPMGQQPAQQPAQQMPAEAVQQAVPQAVQPAQPAQPTPPAQPAQPTPPAQVQPAATQQQSDAEQPLLPWPTFADGSPYPAGPDGQPDFVAAQQR